MCRLVGYAITQALSTQFGLLQAQGGNGRSHRLLLVAQTVAGNPNYCQGRGWDETVGLRIGTSARFRSAARRTPALASC